MNGRDATELTGEEPTQALEPDEDWPVTEFYRVTPDTDEPLPDAAPAPPPTAPPPGRRRLPTGAAGAGLGAAVLLVTLGIGLGAWLLSRDSGEQDAVAVETSAPEAGGVAAQVASQPASSGTKVADVVGMRVTNARAVLTQAGFTVRVKGRASDRPLGEVLEQSPAAGEQLQRGETVALIVARSSKPVVVRVRTPDIVSLPVADATATLRRTGLRAQVQLVASDEEPGTVVGQKPPAGSEVNEGELVEVTVARARAPEVTRVEVPDLVGTTLDEARRTLRSLGLRVSVARVLADAPAGTVVGQTPSATSSIREGAVVRLRVSIGPRSVSVPDVVGLDEPTAVAELEAAGFLVRTSEEPTDDPANDGLVLRQSPSGGSESDEGAVVTIVVGRFD